MKIDIIGRGNVGSHLYKAFKSKADARPINSRTLEGIRDDSDICLLAVTDDSIEQIASRVASLVSDNTIIAHTSGSTPMAILAPYHQKNGVFYPLQTFNKEIELDYSEIPVYLEGSDDNVISVLEQLGYEISKNVKKLDSEGRRNLHISSVFACNFVNHLWFLADDYLKKNNLSLLDLKPLIKETVKKLDEVSPEQGQTGPAKRHDHTTLNRHLEALQNHPEMLNLYKIISKSIMLHHPKL